VREMLKKIIRVLIVTWACLLAFSLVCDAAPDTGVTVGKTIPQFKLNGLDGHSVTIAPSDKVLIINFWATWCLPCQGEMPELNDYYLQNRDQVVFYAVNLEETSAKVKNFMDNNHYSIPTLVDIDGAIGHLFQVHYIPTTVVVDRNGVIQFRKSGGMTRTELEDAVNKARSVK